jgi:hypothetical protein
MGLAGTDWAALIQITVYRAAAAKKNDRPKDMLKNKTNRAKFLIPEA